MSLNNYYTLGLQLLSQIASRVKINMFINHFFQVASFKGHISFGVVVGLAFLAFLTTSAVVADNLLLFLVFMGIMIGTILPDLDSDGGKPFQIVFGIFSFACAIFGFLYAKDNYPDNFVYLVITPLLVFLAVRFVLGPILKKFTNHRGIFHSVPMLLIFGLLGQKTMIVLDFSSKISAYFAIAVMVGALGHLILDELKSATGFSGILLKPSKSLGSALKLFSNDHKINFLVYSFLALAIYANWDMVKYVYGTVIYNLIS